MQPTRLLCPWDFPGKVTGVFCHFLLQGIFPTQGSNLHLLGLLHCQASSLPPPPQDAPQLLEGNVLKKKRWLDVLLNCCMLEPIYRGKRAALPKIHFPSTHPMTLGKPLVHTSWGRTAWCSRLWWVCSITTPHLSQSGKVRYSYFSILGGSHITAKSSSPLSSFSVTCSVSPLVMWYVKEGYLSFNFFISRASSLIWWFEESTHWKRPWCWERLKANGEGDSKGWDG